MASMAVVSHHAHSPEKPSSSPGSTRIGTSTLSPATLRTLEAIRERMSVNASFDGVPKYVHQKSVEMPRVTRLSKPKNKTKKVAATRVFSLPTGGNVPSKPLDNERGRVPRKRKARPWDGWLGPPLPLRYFFSTFFVIFNPALNPEDPIRARYRDPDHDNGVAVEATDCAKVRLIESLDDMRNSSVGLRHKQSDGSFFFFCKLSVLMLYIFHI